MSDEWSVLTWKQKKAIRLALKRNERISLGFLKGIYSDKERRLQAIKTMNRQGFLKSTRFGNKYDVNKKNIPDGVLESCRAQ